MLWVGVMEIQGKYKIKSKIWFEADMYYSKAFRSLSKSAILTLMRCMQKRKWDKVKNRGKKQIIYSNDGFIFPYAEAKLLNIGTTQFWKNIRKLIDLGFIEVIYQGGWFQKLEKEKDYSVYKFSDRWKHYGTPDFKHVVKPKALPYNFTIQAHLKKKKLKVTSQK
jgi:NDP-sugar pyrophosphorylase family protein